MFGAVTTIAIADHYLQACPMIGAVTTIAKCRFTWKFYYNFTLDNELLDHEHFACCDLLPFNDMSRIVKAPFFLVGEGVMDLLMPMSS